MADYTDEAVTWLREHPRSCARDVAAAVGAGHSPRLVFRLLEIAEHQGKVTCTRRGSGPRLWEAVPAAAERESARTIADAYPVQLWLAERSAQRASGASGFPGLGEPGAGRQSTEAGGDA